ncbi:MAG: hypothetical protein OER96_03675 [Gammaproteobacteria bacterium]|nr:hypothetical protein [Gammaproteobacteria bacterium]
MFRVLWLLSASLFFVSAVNADDSRIWFYKLNKKGQQYEIRIVRNTSKAGCFNFPRKAKVFRIGQTGFAHCEVFAEKDCNEASKQIVHWTGDVKRDELLKEPTTQLRPGSMWVIKDNENVILRSWSCTE